MSIWRYKIPIKGLCGNLNVWNLASHKVWDPTPYSKLLFYYICIFIWDPHHNRFICLFSFILAFLWGPFWNKIYPDINWHVPFSYINFGIFIFHAGCQVKFAIVVEVFCMSNTIVGVSIWNLKVVLEMVLEMTSQFIFFNLWTRIQKSEDPCILFIPSSQNFKIQEYGQDPCDMGHMGKGHNFCAPRRVG